MKMSGCSDKYVANAVVPHLGAPTIKKSGLFSEDDFVMRAASAEILSADIGTSYAPSVKSFGRNRAMFRGVTDCRKANKNRKCTVKITVGSITGML